MTQNAQTMAAKQNENTSLMLLNVEDGTIVDLNNIRSSNMAGISILLKGQKYKVKEIWNLWHIQILDYPRSGCEFPFYPSVLVAIDDLINTIESLSTTAEMLFAVRRKDQLLVAFVSNENQKNEWLDILTKTIDQFFGLQPKALSCNWTPSWYPPIAGLV